MITIEDRKLLDSLLQAATNDTLIFFDISDSLNASRVFFTSNSMSITVLLSKLTKNPCNFAIGADKIRSVIGMMPPGPINLSVTAYNATFSCGTTKRVLAVTAADDPVVVELNGDTDDFIISSSSEFSECIAFSGQYLHKDNCFSASNIALSFFDKTIRMVGTDGKILSLIICKQKALIPELSVQISGEHARVIQSFLSIAESTIRFSIDDKNKYSLSSKYGSIVCSQPSVFAVDMTKSVDSVCAIKSNLQFSDNANKVTVDSKELKRVLSHSASIFSKNEFPAIDILITKTKMIFNATSVENVSSLTSEIDVVSDGDYSVRLSPILFSKSVSSFSGKEIVIAWNKGGDPSRQPVCLTNRLLDRLIVLAVTMVKSHDLEE